MSSDKLSDGSELEEEEEETIFSNDPLDPTASLKGVVAPSTPLRESDSEEEDAPGLPGSTPPTHGRYIKMARRGHKHTSTKKLSMGHVPLKAGSRSAPPKLSKKAKTFSSSPTCSFGGAHHRRRHTVHGSKEAKYQPPRWGQGAKQRYGDGGGDSSSGGYQSPAGGEDRAGRRKQKRETRKRMQDRDDKVGQLPSANSTEFSAATTTRGPDSPIEETDFVTDSGLLPPSSFAEDPLVTQSLQQQTFQSNLATKGLGKIGRSNSDAPISFSSLGGSEERPSIHCAPERKQFYRQFRRVIQYSVISNLQRSRLESGAGPGLHFPRQYSENLALENPYGHVHDEIWFELQAYLGGRSLDGQRQWIFSMLDRVNQVLDRVVKFEVPLFGPQRSLNSLFAAAVDRDKDGSEPSNPSRATSGASATCDPVVGSCPPAGENKTDELESLKATQSDLDLCNGVACDAPCDFAQQDSIESKSSGDSVQCDCSHKDFLSPLQIMAMEKVHKLLTEVEMVESFYPNRQRMGDEHRSYRTLVFRRRMEAITLWFKATTGLADRLCALSALLGVPVVQPAFLREAASVTPLRSLSDGYVPPPPADELVPRSPKSPRVKAQFSIGSPTDSEGYRLATSSLKRFDSTPYRSQSAPKPSSSSAGSHDQADLSRLPSISAPSTGSSEHGAYHTFVDRALKKHESLPHLIQMLRALIEPELRIATFALTPLSEKEHANGANEQEFPPHTPGPKRFMDPKLIGWGGGGGGGWEAYDRSTSVQPESWVREFERMNLPLFSRQYLRLVHVPLDVMHECLRLQLVLRPTRTPSAHSVKKVRRRGGGGGHPTLRLYMYMNMLIIMNIHEVSHLVPVHALVTVSTCTQWLSLFFPRLYKENLVIASLNFP